jgi:uncharacterized protein YcnI
VRLSKSFSKLLFGVLAACMLVLAPASTTLAHVTVKPGEVATATYQVFTVNVPNEKTIPTVSVRVVIPESVTSVTPTNKPGWKVSVEKDGDGAEAKVTSISWSGGKIDDGLRDEFTFSAKTPDSAGELKWSAYQTYSDGTVVSWDKEKEGDSHGEDNNSGPFSITNVTTEAALNNDHTTNVTAADAKASADRALCVGIVAVVLGLGAVFLATRKK